jgi:hypothetical protein
MGRTFADPKLLPPCASGRWDFPGSAINHALRLQDHLEYDPGNMRPRSSPHPPI